MKENTQGVIYIATGKKYVAASINSAKSVIHHCKGGMSVSLCCDKENEREAKESGIFDQVMRIKNPHIRSKVDCVQFTPYKRTLYLDADTIVVADRSGPHFLDNPVRSYFPRHQAASGSLMDS